MCLFFFEVSYFLLLQDEDLFLMELRVQFQATMEPPSSGLQDAPGNHSPLPRVSQRKSVGISWDTRLGPAGVLGGSEFVTSGPVVTQSQLQGVFFQRARSRSLPDLAEQGAAG